MLKIIYDDKISSVCVGKSVLFCAYTNEKINYYIGSSII